MEVYIVYKKGYKEDIWDNPQGRGKEIIEEIVSVRLTEDAAKEEIKTSTFDDLEYIKKHVK